MRHQQRVSQLERSCDDLRRSIETVLLTQMLIPESRSDVLRLINLLDGLLDRIKRELLSMTIDLPKPLHEDMRRLVAAICAAIDSTVIASRAFFIDPRSVRDHVHKNGIHESEADAVSIRMKQKIFASDRDLAQKMMLRDFINSLDRLVDQAEAVQAPENHQGQDDVLVLAALERVANEVGDFPQERNDFSVFHEGPQGVDA